MARDLFIDLTDRRLAADVATLAPSGSPTFTRGDITQFNLYFLEATGDIAVPFEITDQSASSVNFAIGDLTAEPTSGTFTLSYAAETSGALTYSATAGAISSALNALTTISAAGGVSVSGDAIGHATIQFNSNGARSAITANTALLLPDTTASITIRRSGSASQPEVQDLDFSVNPYVLQATWSDTGTALTSSIATTITGTASVNNTQTISLSRPAFAGAFTLTMPTTFNAVDSVVTDGLFITTNNHGLASNQQVTLTGFSAMTGFVQDGTPYFVKSLPSRKQFTLSVTAGGTLLTGSGTTGVSSGATTILQSTDPLSYTTTSAELQTALQNLSSIGANNASVTGDNTSGFGITFVGEKAFTSFPTMGLVSTLSAAPLKNALVDFTGLNLRDAMSSSSSPFTLSIQLNAISQTTTVIQQDCFVVEKLQR
jgi:hypothetical protein